MLNFLIFSYLPAIKILCSIEGSMKKVLYSRALFFWLFREITDSRSMHYTVFNETENVCNKAKLH